jgi:phosphate:Na+ symporter
MAESGLLGAEATAMVIYGAHLGNTLFRMLVGGGMRGSSRQVAGFQDLIKITGTVVFVPLLYLEIYGKTPLVLALARAASSNIETQMALTNLVYSISLALGFTFLSGPTLRFLEWLWPVTASESFSKVQYLDQEALAYPETALDLAEKEQLRLVQRLPDFLAGLTEGGLARENSSAQLWAADDLHRSFSILAGEIDSYCASLVDREHSHGTSERLINMQSRQSLIEFLEEALYNLVTTVRETPPTPQLQPLVHNVADALDFLLRTAADAAASVQPSDADLLLQMCADRGELMGKIRSMHLAAERNLGQADKSLLLTLTTLFERIVWMLKRFGKLLQKGAFQSS